MKGHVFAVFKMGQVRKMRFRDLRFVKMDSFKTNLSQFVSAGCDQHAGVYLRTVTVEWNVTDSGGRTTDVLWLGVDTK
jgi:hypothetical protein